MLIDQLKSEFRSDVRERGKGYAGGGRVISLEMGRGVIEAVVRGSEDYEVSIEVKQGRELAAAIVGDDSAERDGPLSSLTREELGWLLGA